MELKYEERQVKIIKHNRTWTDVELQPDQHHDSSFKTRAKKNDMKQYNEGETYKIKCALKIEYNGYGSKHELIIQDTESYESYDNYNRTEAERWMNYFRENANKATPYFYSKAVDKIRELGCHDFDDEISELSTKIEKYKKEKNLKYNINKWIGYFRENANKATPYFYSRAVEELHKLGCHDFDDEINETRQKIDEIEKQYTHIALAAYDGFYGKPQKDDVIMHKSVPYKVIHCTYNKYDGWSFGANNDEWYDIKAIDISDTNEGKEMIEHHEREKEHMRLLAQKKSLINDIYKRVTSAKRITGEHNISEYINEKTIIKDSFDIYGYGEIISYSETESLIFAIINNGSDSSNWGINNIVTGGAGAFGYYDTLNHYTELIFQLHELEQKINEFEER